MRFLTMIKFYITSTFSKRSIFAVTAIMLLLILSLSNGLAFLVFDSPNSMTMLEIYLVPL